MNRERWLILGSHIPPAGHLGGMVRYTVQMIRALESLDSVEVHVHCRSDATEVFTDDVGISGDRVHATESQGPMVDGVRELVGLGRLVEAVSPDVIFGSKHVVPLRPFAADARRVLTVHDLLPFDRPGDFGKAKRWLLPSIYRRSLREADVLACVSEATRRRLVDLFPATEQRAIVVANAMTPSLAAVDPSPMELVGTDGFVLVVGDRSPRKNVGFIVELWPDVLEHRPNAQLVLVGPPGWGTNEAAPGIRELVSTGSVVEAGHVSDARLRWAYEHAAVTLCPSRLEGFGLPVVEALGLGCPVIHSADPAQVEAAAGAGTAIGLEDRGAWVESIVRHLDGVPRPRPSITRTWDDAASELAASSARVPLQLSGRR